MAKAENQTPIKPGGNPDLYKGKPAQSRSAERYPKNTKTIVKKGLTQALADKVDVNYIADKLLKTCRSRRPSSNYRRV
jgi:hypothetical protein